MTMRQLTLISGSNLILPADMHRKSALIINTSDTNDLYLHHMQNGYSTSNYITIKPNNRVQLKIPEDVPQKELWGTRAGSPLILHIYEEQKKTGKGVRNI